MMKHHTERKGKEMEKEEKTTKARRRKDYHDHQATTNSKNNPGHPHKQPPQLFMKTVDKLASVLLDGLLVAFWLSSVGTARALVVVQQTILQHGVSCDPCCLKRKFHTQGRSIYDDF